MNVAASPSQTDPPGWMPIPSAPGYFASRDGAILGKRGRVMRPIIDRRGYPRISAKIDGRERTVLVHILVCEAFQGRKPSPRHQAAHNDGNPGNPRAKNLRWATPMENCLDKKLHGTWPSGEKNGRALLTEANVAEIRKIYAASVGKKYVKRGTREALAAQFGVGIHVIKDVVAGRSWPHVEIDLPFMAPPESDGADV